MIKTTSKYLSNKHKLKLTVLALIVLFNITPALFAVNYSQDKITDLFYYYNKPFDMNRAINGTDIIFKSNFEPVPILSMSASPENINSGESSVVSWTLSNNAESCLKTGDWSGTFVGSDVTNGMHSIEIPNITSQSIYNLQCTNTFGDSPLRSVVVYINGPPVISNFIATPTTVPINGTTILSWTLANNATTCTKFGDWVGNLSGADVANGNHNLLVTGIANDSNYFLGCSNTFGITPMLIVSVFVDNTVVVPAISNFVASPSQVFAGESSTLSWSLTGNATSCTKSGDWSGSLSGSNVSDGNYSEVITNITTDSTYNLQCSNDDGQTGLAMVTVHILQSASDCSDPLINPVALQRDSYREIYISDSGLDLSGGATPTISDNNWPALNEIFRMSLLRNKYLALEFNTDPITTTSAANLIFKPAPANYGYPPNGTTYSISECPGDFRQSLGKCLNTVNNPASFFWSTSGEYTDDQLCNLEVNKKYYFNIIHSANSFDFDVSSCSESSCGVMFWNSEN